VYGAAGVDAPHGTGRKRAHGDTEADTELEAENDGVTDGEIEDDAVSVGEPVGDACTLGDTVAEGDTDAVAAVAQLLAGKSAAAASAGGAAAAHSGMITTAPLAPLLPTPPPGYQGRLVDAGSAELPLPDSPTGELSAAVHELKLDDLVEERLRRVVTVVRDDAAVSEKRAPDDHLSLPA
jgi:hypothetical protein